METNKAYTTPGWTAACYLIASVLIVGGIGVAAIALLIVEGQSLGAGAAVPWILAGASTVLAAIPIGALGAIVDETRRTRYIIAAIHSVSPDPKGGDFQPAIKAKKDTPKP